MHHYTHRFKKNVIIYSIVYKYLVLKISHIIQLGYQFILCGQCMYIVKQACKLYKVMFILCGTQYAHGIFLNTVHTTIFSYINHFTVSSVMKQDIHTNAEKNIHTQYCIQYISFYKIQRLVFLVLFKFMQHRLSKGLSPRFYPINLSTDEEIS